MSEFDGVLAGLRLVLEDPSDWRAQGAVERAVAWVEGREAELVALQKAVARLTPKELSAEEACAALNAHAYLADRRCGDDLRWRVDRYGRLALGRLDCNGRPSAQADVLELWEAVCIVHGLEVKAAGLGCDGVREVDGGDRF